MRQIKTALDPLNLMNLGKVLPRPEGTDSLSKPLNLTQK